jgi:hypothetical protein
MCAFQKTEARRWLNRAQTSIIDWVYKLLKPVFNRLLLDKKARTRKQYIVPQENEVAFSCPLWSAADLIIDDQIGKYGVVPPVLLCPFRARADHLSDYVNFPISANKLMHVGA